MIDDNNYKIFSKEEGDGVIVAIPPRGALS